jgi:hypothetical protein
VRGLHGIRRLLAVVAAGFLATTAPFERRLFERSPLLAAAGLLLLVLRAAALGFGYLAGTAYWTQHRTRHS